MHYSATFYYDDFDTPAPQEDYSTSDNWEDERSYSSSSSSFLNSSSADDYDSYTSDEEGLPPSPRPPKHEPESEEAFYKRISRLTPLPNKWCVKTGKYVFPDDMVIPDVFEEDVEEAAAPKTWDIPAPDTDKKPVNMQDIFANQTLEQIEEEKVKEQRRKDELRRQEAQMNHDRNRNHHDRNRNHHDRNRNHHDRNRNHHDRNRNHHDHNRNHHDHNRNHHDHNRNHHDRNYSSSIGSQHSIENPAPRRPTLLVNNVVKKDSEGFQTVSYKKPRAQREDEPKPQHGHMGRPDLLCIHRKGHDFNCELAHSIADWQPKFCKYNASCSKKDRCSYWHQELESKEKYLERAIKEDVVFFRKNKQNYISTYHLSIKNYKK